MNDLSLYRRQLEEHHVISLHKTKKHYKKSACALDIIACAVSDVDKFNKLRGGAEQSRIISESRDSLLREAQRRARRTEQR